MRFTGLAVAIALAGTWSVATAQALPIAPQHHAGNVYTVAAKGPGRCGTHMHWNAKQNKCVDARSKASSSNWKPF